MSLAADRPDEAHGAAASPLGAHGDRLRMILDAVGDITFEVDLKRHTLLWQDRAWHWLSKEVPDTPVELSSVFR